MDRNHWARAERPDQVLAPGAEPIVDAVRRLQGVLDDRAPAFAELRFGTQEGLDLRLGRRGLLGDEAASFLRAVDSGLLTIDETGRVEVGACRPKPGGGRYSLFAANRFGGEMYVSLNLEYLIHLGAAAELVAFYGWPSTAVEVEVGEYDAVAHGSDRVVLAMEAKARVDGPDSLTGLWHSFVDFASSDEPPEPSDNHSRKYVELLRLTEGGPVVLWLVAAQARWPSLATRVDSHIEFEAFPTVEWDRVLEASVGRVALPVERQLNVEPTASHAVDIGRLTEFDGQPRCYEFPWRNESELDVFAADLRQRAQRAGIEHARVWKWRADSSGGDPMTPSGRTTGLELRFSYYAD